MDESETRCRRCDGLVASTKSGSLTQWMNTCRCDQAAGAESNETALPICNVCAKPIFYGRKGSLTQWIFSSNRCCCVKPNPAPGDNLQSSADLPKRKLSESERLELADINSQARIEFEPGSFPDERYTPLSKLGFGASGEVYLCADKLLKKRVAVKILHQLTSDQLISFQNEARTTSILNHPSIMQTLDFGATKSGVPYMVMEYFPSYTLENIIRENGAMQWPAALGLALRLCEALEFAHRKGVFHRDVKPANILLSDRNAQRSDIRLIDFGIAKFAQHQTISQGKALVGTPTYMSPDQLLGIAYDARSELYSVGCVIWELLAGRPPFLGETALETLSMHVHQPLSAFPNESDIPLKVEELVKKCLEKKPEKRFQSISELTDQIKILLNDPDAVESETVSPTQPKQLNRISYVRIAVFLIVIGFASMFVFSSLREDATGRKLSDSRRASKTTATPEEKRRKHTQKIENELNSAIDREENLPLPAMLPHSDNLDEFQKRLAAGQSFAKSHKYEEAKNEYKFALRNPGTRSASDQGIIQSRLLLAQLYLEQRQAIDAIETLQPIFSETVFKKLSNQHRSDALQLMAVGKVQIKAYQEAEKLLLQLSSPQFERTSTSDNKQMIRSLLLECYVNQKKIAQADKTSLAIIGNTSNSFPQSLFLIQAGNLIASRERARAIQLYKRAYDILCSVSPDHILEKRDVLHSIIINLHLQGEDEEGRSYCKKAVKLIEQNESQFPNLRREYLELVRLCSVVRLKPEGLRCCDLTKKCLEVESQAGKNVDPKMVKAAVLEEVGGHEYALGDLLKGRRTMYESVAIYEHFHPKKAVKMLKSLGDLATSVSDPELAILDYERAIEIYNTMKQASKVDSLYRELLFCVATRYTTLGRFEKAEKFLLNPIFKTATAEEKSQQSYRLAVIHRFQFKTADAERELSAMRPGFDKTCNFAFLKMEMGQFRDANQLFDQALAMTKTPVAWSSVSAGKAVCYHLQKRDLEAEQLLKAVLTKEPKESETFARDCILLANQEDCLAKPEQSKRLRRQAIDSNSLSLKARQAVTYELKYFEDLLRHNGLNAEADRINADCKALVAKRQ